MSIYSKKIVWKRLLFLLALLIIGSSFWYTSRLVERIATEERKQVQLWAQAIQKKAKLVNYTNKLFRELQTEERKRVELWTEATQQLVASEEINLALQVVESNTTIPIILIDQDSLIVGHRNVQGVVSFSKDTLSEAEWKRLQARNDSLLHANLSEMMALGNRIDVNYYGSSFNYLFYKDSRLFSELKNTFNDLQVSFISEIVSNSASTPVLFTNSTRDSIIASGNLDTGLLSDPTLLAGKIRDMSAENTPIEIDLGNGTVNYIFYEDSDLLQQLKYYPFVQFFVIGLFILVGYWLFSTSRKSEQNQVWVGMSKETAHQLGTPLSSLIGWIDLLKAKEIQPDIVLEMEKDLGRLEMITDRFSKIGAKPKLAEEDVVQIIEDFITYLKTRSPNKVQFIIENVTGQPIRCALNVPLFGWVIENLCKNAMDAMNGAGTITLRIESRDQKVWIDVTDTGKGIPTGKRKQVFQPGYTSKKRGWGLGLSLSKRIIENYHQGKIFVKASEAGKSTTFRIVLNS